MLNSSFWVGELSSWVCAQTQEESSPTQKLEFSIALVPEVETANEGPEEVSVVA